MKLQRFPSAAAFLEPARPFLLRAEAENSVILGIAGDLAREAGQGASTPYFATVRDGEEIIVCAFSSVPSKVGLTRASNPAALHLLATDVIEACPEMQVVLGPEPTALIFAGLVAKRLGTIPRPWMRQRIHELRAVEPLPELPAGRLRPADIGDLGLVTQWVAEFMVHAGDQGDAAEVARDRISRGLLHVWEDGEVVSMAAWTGQTPNGVRISLVYTPEALRGRGYATACVAALSRKMLLSNRYCCLYTDLANPTSNAIYYRIGYRPVCDAAVYSIRDT
jgi:hypothetical protein